MTRFFQVLLHETLTAPEGRNGLTHRRVVQFGDLLECASDLESAATATERCLDGDGEAVLAGEGNDLVGVRHRISRAGDLWCTRARSNVPR